MTGLVVPSFAGFVGKGVTAPPRTPYNFFVFRQTANRAGGYFAMAEWSLRNSASGPNVVGTAVATLAVRANAPLGGYPLSNLIDGDVNTQTIWNNGSTTDFNIAINSGTIPLPNYIAITPTNGNPDGNGDSAPSAFALFASSDGGSNFTQVFSATGVTWTAAAQTFVIP